MKTVINGRNALVTAALIGGFMGAAPAGAVSVDTWDFRVESAFTSATDADAGSSETTGIIESEFNTSGVFGGNPTDLAWGEPSQDTENSGIGVDGLTPGAGFGTTTGSVMTNGPSVAASQIFHRNNAIDPGTGELDTAVLGSALFLDPTDPDLGGETGLPALTFNINFEETLNSAPCSVDSDQACADIFVIDIEGAGFNVATGAVEQKVDLFDESYLVSIAFGMDQLGVLEDDVCAEAGASSGCIGFTTEESQTTTIDTSFNIRQVSEPGTLMLFGSSLLGLGLVRRLRGQRRA